jgi:predicted TIM-barrel fold metal-dependent hydrolase
MMSILHKYRSQYLAARRALPWLDASYYPGEKPALGSFALPGEHATARSGILRAGLAGQLCGKLTDEGIMLWRWVPPESGALAELEDVIRELSENKLPLVVRQTDLTFHELELFASAHPRLAVILESGPQKLLYHIEQIESKMLKCPNLYLSTYNFCNWLGLERFCSRGLTDRLLFGSHAPRFSPDAAMGPVIMSGFSWEEQCALAGNNLRRLLNLPLKHPGESTWQNSPPFIIDAHAHNVLPGSNSLFGFPTPDEDFSPADWIAAMDCAGILQSFLIPLNALVDSNISARECAAALIRHAPERIRFLTVFHPAMDESQCKRVATELADKFCVGLKIHPALHRLEADHPAYAKAFSLAGDAGKPLVTHSWEISDYNPAQQLAHPDRFRKHLAEHPEVTLVLGHAGGRSATLENVANLCGEFPRTMVDVSGDYFDNGLIDCLAGRLGIDKIMFGSDADWIDPRCNLGPVFASRLPDEALLKILHGNARRVADNASLNEVD